MAIRVRVWWKRNFTGLLSEAEVWFISGTATKKMRFFVERMSGGRYNGAYRQQNRENASDKTFSLSSIRSVAWEANK